ncbi:MAG: class I SAM-dependent RNA methyltransferase [Bdellovibrionales bacterium]|nr:class I SAM-dependent RNA methyltransferase [Oligoflexia bacterium]
METHKVIIHDLARGGSGVGKLDTGEIIFVPFTAPGDEVLVRITKSHKNYHEGERTEILRPSTSRITPPCPVFEKCGGCSWQHIPYPLQFETKKKGLLQALKRGGPVPEGIPLDEFPAEQHYHYRNRVQLRGLPAEKKIGYYAHASKTVIGIDHCPIAEAKINEALPTLAQEGFGQFNEEFKLEIDVSPKGEVRHAFNQAHAAFGFRQVNDEQNIKLQHWIQTHFPKGDLLLDLYGGAGNLSLPLARHFKEVHCVDMSSPFADAATPKHFHYEKMDMVKWAKTPTRVAETLRKTSVILDPPREGISSYFEKIEAKISRHDVERLALIGCDVDSFVRDTHRFIKAGYRLERLGVLDLFPQTPHVESLALFSK